MSNLWIVTDSIRFDLKATDLVREERINKCDQCNELSAKKFCNQCGCFMPIKTWLKSSECPLKKW